MRVEDVRMAVPPPLPDSARVFDAMPEVLVDIEMTVYIDDEETKLSFNTLRLTRPGQLVLEIAHEEHKPGSTVQLPVEGPKTLTLNIDEAMFAEQTWMYKMEIKNA